MTYICAKQNSSFTADHCSDTSARAFNLISAVLGTVIAVSIIICLAAAVVAVRLAAVRVSVCAAVIVLVLIVLKKTYSPLR